MKIRNGFVSNSSSSSFVVIFDKKPSSKEEIKNILFHDNNSIVKYDDYEASVDNIVNILWNDINKIKKANKNDLVKVFSNGYNEYKIYAKKVDIDKQKKLENEDKKYHKNYIKEYNCITEEIESNNDKSLLVQRKALEDKNSRYCSKYWKKMNKLIVKMAKDSVNKILDKYKNKYIVILNYSDNDGHIGIIMEHGNIFKNIKHYRISYH